MGKSYDSAEDELRNALLKFPFSVPIIPYANIKTHNINNHNHWWHMDIVNAIKPMYYFNFKEPLNAPSWWFGIAIDWELDWVFAPTEVAFQRLMVGKSTNHAHDEPKHYLRWDILGNYARTKRQLKKFSKESCQ